MLLIPDPNTAVIDPHPRPPDLNINCFVRDPRHRRSRTAVTPATWPRRPRITSGGSGLATRPTSAPSGVLHLRLRPLRQNQNSSYHYVDSIEGA